MPPTCRMGFVPMPDEIRETGRCIMLTITNTVRDITKLSTSRFIVKHDKAIVRDMAEAKQQIVTVCRALKLSPNEFLITSDCGEFSVRPNHSNPSVFTGK